MEPTEVDVDELIEFWALLDEDRELLAGTRGSTALGFALLLKHYSRHGRFPRGRGELVDGVVRFVAGQLGVDASDLGFCRRQPRPCPAVADIAAGGRRSGHRGTVGGGRCAGIRTANTAIRVRARARAASPQPRVRAAATAPTNSGPPASPSSRPTSAAPMVWPSRSGGVLPARCANATGVANPVPAPISTAAIRIPPTGGITAAANKPSAAIPMPAVMPSWSDRVPASRARPARGCTTMAVSARRDTTAPAVSGVIPSWAPMTGRNPTPVASAAVAAVSVRVGRRKLA